eukprot:TRINITY_DN17716_c0_g1_i1.p1 TRINITY_DN17716_c0_g1~~TRINITY_DN17716_c0_g1_i1.p1  ORF type:complete len:415 (+),score=139.56 TRINITY_DN17716_c0_g1_i1:821-2065(+)
MGFTAPSFDAELNPVPFLDAVPRSLTTLYLAALHVALVFCFRGFAPIWEVEPLESFADPRLLLCAAALAGAAAVLASRSRVLCIGLSALLLPLLPATGLLFPVGFTVAERVLYLPSMGACVLAAAQFQRLLRPGSVTRFVVVLAAAGVVAGYGAATVVRCGDWRTEEALMRAAVAAHPSNARVHSGLAALLSRSPDAADLSLAAELSARAAAIRQRQGRPALETDACTRGTALEAAGDVAGAERSYRTAVGIAKGVRQLERDVGSGFESADIDAHVVTTDAGELTRCLHHLARILFRRAEKSLADTSSAAALHREVVGKYRAALRLSESMAGEHAWVLQYDGANRAGMQPLRLDALLHSAIAHRRLGNREHWRSACDRFAAEHEAAQGHRPNHPGVLKVCAAAAWGERLPPMAK